MKEIVGSPVMLQITRDELERPELRGFVIVSAISAGHGVDFLEGYLPHRAVPIQEEMASAADSAANLNGE